MQKRRFGFLSKGELYDSRFWGMVENSKIKGTVKTIYWSWDRKELAVRWNRMGKIVQ
jgi:signal peptidase I